MQEFTFKGSELLGLEYEPLMAFAKDYENSFQVLHADFVTTEDGTGIVHIAPGFGEDDHKICKENGIEIYCPVDDGGCFTIKEKIPYFLGEKKEILDLEEKQVFETNDDIIKYLKSKNLWLKTEQYIHNYPHCWRTDTPLIYRAVPSWYVAVTGIAKGEKKSVKEKMIENNQKINWIPENIRDGQMGKWLENAHDWSISRNRFWGCPIPVWKDINGNIKVFGSIKELEDFFQEQYIKDYNNKLNSGKYIQKDGTFKITDLHRPYVDELVIRDENNAITLKRVTDVLDCWFESGAMPFASVHYPFANRKNMEENLNLNNFIPEKNPPRNFPADFIVEYVAQTRGWFYTLQVLGAALFDDAPFKNCICHGVILDENSQKLSKRLRNYPDPLEVFEKYGSDAMRWAMLRTPVMRGGCLNIDKEGKMFEDSIKNVLNPIWNALKFYITYAKIDNFSGKNFNNNIKISEINDNMDLYLLSKFKNFSEEFKNFMDKYDVTGACLVTENFIDILNNWYIRCNKSRFWSNENNKSKTDAYKVLHFILKNFAIILSPLLPHLSEEIYQEIKNIPNVTLISN